MNLIILFEHVKINWISNIDYFTFNLKILSFFYKKKKSFCYKNPYIYFALNYLLLSAVCLHCEPTELLNMNSEINLNCTSWASILGVHLAPWQC
jgi:hypothetical protein